MTEHLCYCLTYTDCIPHTPPGTYVLSMSHCLRRAAAHLALSLCSSLVFKLYNFCHVTSIRLSTTINFYLFPTFLCVHFQACSLDSRFTSLSLCPPRHTLLWPRFACVYSHGVSQVVTCLRSAYVEPSTLSGRLMTIYVCSPRDTLLLRLIE